MSKSFDALQTLGEDGPNLKDLLDNLQKWLIRNKPTSITKYHEESTRGIRNWFAGKGNGGKLKSPKCVFCKGEHYSDSCEIVKEIDSHRYFSYTDNLMALKPPCQLSLWEETGGPGENPRLSAER